MRRRARKTRTISNQKSMRVRIYADTAAAAPLIPSALSRRNSREQFYGNPGSIHEEGRMAKAVLDDARKGIARLLAVKDSEMLFTSGGTESNNLAIMGYVRRVEIERGGLEGFHGITSSIEHSSVLECFKEIERRGGSVTYVDPDRDGLISETAVRNAVTEKTVFVSFHYVHGEIGVIQPLRKLARAVREKKMSQSADAVVIHADASQAPLYVDVTPHTLGVDLMTLDGLKIGGPRGAGLLFKKQSVHLAPILFGGGQEFGLRPGTEHVGAAAGTEYALAIAVLGRKSRTERLLKIQSYAYEVLQRVIPGVMINGSIQRRSPANINISVPGIDAEYAAVVLDALGVACGTKSACLPHDGGGSDTVRVISGDEKRARGALRFSFAPTVTKKDIDRIVQALKEAAGRSKI